MKQITHETETITITVREKIGMDEIDGPTIALALRDHAMKLEGIEDPKAIPDRIWARVSHVCDVIQQTVSVGGKDRIDVPQAYAPNEDLCDFYDFYLRCPPDTVTAFRRALKKVEEKEIPNVTGANTETNSVNAHESDSSIEMAAETNNQFEPA